jgi:chromosome segregation ATPase
MGKPALPVYSDFSHMSAQQGIGGIRFAVSLREENPDAIVARVFPLTKIIPVEIKEKKKPKKPKKQEEKVCSRPDCAARKDKLTELKDANKSLRENLQSLGTKLETTRNKISLTEKSILMAEEKNDTLNGQIEEAQNRIISMETDVEKAEIFNQTLRRQLEALQQEIENINAQTSQATAELQDLLEDKSERKIIFSRNPKHRDNQLATEVSTLRFPTDGNDSD